MANQDTMIGTGSLSVGINLPTRSHPEPLGMDTLMRIAETVDSVDGWAHAWVGDSILALPYFDSTVILGALAARTRRIRVGVACLASLGLRHPVSVLREWSDLDYLSAGRMTMVVCPGNATGLSVEAELRVFGMDYTEKVQRFEDAVRFLRHARAIPAGEPITYRSPFLSLENVTIRPGFVQRPLPIWMTANPTPTAAARTVTRLLTRVAELGDGWMTYNITPELLARRVTQLRDIRAAAGHAEEQPRFPVCVFLNGNVARDGKTALADAAVRWAQQGTRSITVDDLPSIGAIGSPERAADFIGRLQDAGATHIVIEALSPDPEAQIETLGERLLPLLDTGLGPGSD